MHNTLLNTWFPHPRKYYFPEHFQYNITTFPGQSIQDLKVINQDMSKKAYHIYSMYDRLLIFLLHSLLLTPFSCLIHSLLSKF